jgi:hypothetical protein
MRFAAGMEQKSTAWGLRRTTLPGVWISEGAGCMFGAHTVAFVEVLDVLGTAATKPLVG